MMRFLKQAIFAVMLAVAGTPALAETRDDGTFTIYIRGLKFGTISYSGVIDGNRYATASRIEASGLIGALVKARYDAKSVGTYADGRFIPARYDETAQRGSRNTVSILRYSGGVPAAKEQTPPQNPRPSDISPAAQGGTLDPSTAIFVAMRSMPPDEVCQVNYSMYDGRYRARIAITSPQPQGDGVVCSGVYEREGGYTEEELSEGRSFPFTVTYVPDGNGLLQMQELQMSTIYGAARVTRR